jgi:DNA processing protein
MQISKHNYKAAEYPEALRHIASAPKDLFVLGKLHLDRPLVAIVGSRKPSKYGEQVTYQLASDLAAAGVGVVSGLALGIDAIAHRAALDAGGYTIAVMAHGLNQIYPVANRNLGHRILQENGAIISEYPEDTPSLPQHFPARNRIIAGLCAITIVTEATVESGSLITANFANEQGRVVMAVPGDINAPRSSGPNNLIKAGATPITSSSDVLLALQMEDRGFAPEITPASAQEAKILELMEDGNSSSQQLIAASQLSAAEFAHIISLMEITGKVRNLGAGIWIKAGRRKTKSS